MIYGIGTDIVSIARMRGALERHGPRIAERILALDELEEFGRSNQPASFLAKRFAVKEAAAKALGTGFTQGVALRQIAVAHDTHGRPMLLLTERTAELARQLGVGEGLVSVSDEKEYALAFVTLLRR